MLNLFLRCCRLSRRFHYFSLLTIKRAQGVRNVGWYFDCNNIWYYIFVAPQMFDEWIDWTYGNPQSGPHEPCKFPIIAWDLRLKIVMKWNPFDRTDPKIILSLCIWSNKMEMKWMLNVNTRRIPATNLFDLGL